MWERPASFLGQAAAIKYTRDMVFHVFKDIILRGTVYIWSQIVQSAIASAWLLTVSAELGYVLPNCFVSPQIIALQCKLLLLLPPFPFLFS